MKQIRFVVQFWSTCTWQTELSGHAAHLPIRINNTKILGPCRFLPFMRVPVSLHPLDKTSSNWSILPRSSVSRVPVVTRQYSCYLLFQIKMTNSQFQPFSDVKATSLAIPCHVLSIFLKSVEFVSKWTRHSHILLATNIAALDHRIKAPWCRSRHVVTRFAILTLCYFIYYYLAVPM